MNKGMRATCTDQLSATKRLGAIEDELDAWAQSLVSRADELCERLDEHRRRYRATRRNTKYLPLVFDVRQRGNSLELRWQKCHRQGPLGQRRKNGGMWFSAVRKLPKAQGDGYDLDSLRRLAGEHELDLVLYIEDQARMIRLEHRDLMSVRRGLTTVKLRYRRRFAERPVPKVPDPDELEF